LILALDTYYFTNNAQTAGVFFNWKDAAPSSTHTNTLDEVQDYVPGAFYKRELPCILHLLQTLDLSKTEAILIDGHVYVDNDKKYGLGGYLWEALEQKIPIIGVAKRSYKGTEKVCQPIFRGTSKNPLYVSTIGTNLEKAAVNVSAMHGEFRIPDVLKKLDQLSRESSMN